MEDIGKYVKALLVSSFVYWLSAGVSGYSLNDLFTPPPPFGVQTISWFFEMIMKLIYSAFTIMTFPMLPFPLNILLAMIFGFLFIYGVIGIIYSVLKLIGGSIGGILGGLI